MRSWSLSRQLVAALIAAALLGVGLAGCESGGRVAATTTTAAADVLIPVPTVVAGSDTYKWGYINTSGAWVIQPQFEKAAGFDGGPAPVEVGDKWGYADTTGKLVVQPQFTEAHGFAEGLARVATLPAPYPDDRWLRTASGYGFIDPTGKMVIPATYDDAGYFAGGLAPVMVKSKCGFINTRGEIVIPLRYDIVSEFSEGLAAASVGGKWGYVDTKGRWAIPPTYPEEESQEASDWPEDGGDTEEANGVLDELGPSPAGPFHEGLARVGIRHSTTNPDGSGESELQWAYIDKSGKRVFGKQYEFAGDFSDGLAPVYGDGTWAFIDATGQQVLTGDFQDGSQSAYLLSDSGFHEELVAISKEGKTGYMDRSGKMVVQPQFRVGHGFDHGVAYVQTFKAPPTTTLEDEWLPQSSLIGPMAVIDKTGRVIYQAPEGTQYKPPVVQPHVHTWNDSVTADSLVFVVGPPNRGNQSDPKLEQFSGMLEDSHLYEVKVTITNRSDKPVEISPALFTAYAVSLMSLDSTGESPMDFPTTLGTQLPTGTVAPGQTVTGFLAYVQENGFKLDRIGLAMTGPGGEHVTEEWKD